MNKINCYRCGDPSFKAVVLHYIYKTEKFDLEDGFMTIENARILRCGNCGEIAQDESELKRWESLAWREELKQSGSEELQCVTCGLPQRMLGVMISVGFEPKTVTYCEECYDKSQGKK